MQIRVNGIARDYAGDPAMPLLWYVRDVLGLTGTKFGCGIGACGACTVHLDGRAVRGCTTPVSAVGGKSVTTIEGLNTEGRHPVQVAWRAHQVPQCGYCQSGQLMQAAALLAQTPDPSDAQIDQAMRGNVCRCGTYARIRAAIHDAGQLGHASTSTGPPISGTSAVVPVAARIPGTGDRPTTTRAPRN
jgi:isoquinoline 1-oxidoreductase alpha subunit